MMIDHLKRALKRYGNTVTITHGGRSKVTKAFIQPLRRRHKLYFGDKTVPAGSFNNGYKYYIGDTELAENDVILLHSTGEEMAVVIHEEFIVGDETAYNWAILRPKKEQKEDDYDDING